jgi:hypothetical protein
MKGLIGYAIALFGVSFGMPVQAQLDFTGPSTPVLSALTRGNSYHDQLNVVFSPNAVPNAAPSPAPSPAPNGGDKEDAEGMSDVNEVPNPVIVIGRSPQHPFAVIVLSDQWNTLQIVRQSVGAAFLTDSRLGAYVFAESFSQRRSAEALSRSLRSQRLDARVIYFPSRSVKPDMRAGNE